MQAATNFKRLPGRRRGVVRRASIWDGGEYLLSISGTVFSERYHRFYYRDIKALVVQRGPRLGSIGALVLLVWFLLPTAFLIPQMKVLPALNLVWLLPVAWLAFIIYTSIARSCRVYIYTAVSSEELPALFRRRSANKALPYLRNKIEQAQGHFDHTLGQNIINEAAALPTIHEQQPVSRQTLYSALIYFGLVLASAFFAFWYSDTPLVRNSLFWAKITLCVLNALEVIIGVWALSKLFSVRVLSTIRIFIIAGLGLLALRSYALLIVLTGFKQQRQLLTEAINTVHLRQWVGTGDGILSTIVSIVGLISLIMAWQDDRRGTPSSL